MLTGSKGNDGTIDRPSYPAMDGFPHIWVGFSTIAAEGGGHGAMVAVQTSRVGCGMRRRCRRGVTRNARVAGPLPYVPRRKW